MEFLWLLAVLFVPLVYFGRSYGEGSSVVGSYELPKIALLRTLVGLMSALWLLEWVLVGRLPSVANLRYAKFQTSIAALPATCIGWLNAKPARWLNLAVALYLGSTLLSTLLSVSFSVSMWGDVPGQDGYSAYTVLAYVILFSVISTHVKTAPQLWRLVGTLITVGVLVSGYAVLQHYGHDFLDLIEPPGHTRATSSMGNPVFAAAVLVMTIPATLAVAAVYLHRPLRFIRGKFWLWLGLWSSLLTVQLLGIVFTFSRGPWIGAILALAAVMFLSVAFAGRSTFARVILVLGVASVVTSAIIFIPPRIDRAETTTTSSVSEATTTRVGSQFASIGGELASGGLAGRVQIWKDSWPLIAERPWFDFENLSFSALRPLIGYGPELFRASFLLESPPIGSSLYPQEAANAHNLFIHQTVELGFLGLLALLGMFAALYLVGGGRLLKYRRDYSVAHKLVLAGVLAALTGRLLEQMVGVSRVSDLTTFWVLLGIFSVLPATLPAGTHTQQPEDPHPHEPESDRRPRTTNSAISYGWPIYAKATVATIIIVGLGVLTWTKTVNVARAAIVADGGAELLRSGRLPAALSALDRAIELAPEVSTYRQERSSVYQAYSGNNQQPNEVGCNPRGNSTDYDICLAMKQYSADLEWSRQRRYHFRSRLALAESALHLGLLTGDSTLTDDSIRLHREVSQMIPSSWPLRNREAEVYILLGQHAAALPKIEESVAITGDTKYSANALLLRADVYRSQGKIDAALDELDETIRLQPKADQAYFDRGRIYFDNAQVDLALKDFNEAIRRHSHGAVYYVGRGAVYYSLGRFLRAIEDFDQAIGLDDSLIDAYNNRGLAYAKLENLESALQDFNTAIKLDPQSANGYNNRGFVHRDLGHHSEAMDDLDRAVELQPEFALAYYNRALLHTLLGEHEQAQRDFELAVAFGFPSASLGQATDKMK